MIYIIILIGKTASGKDKIVNELISKYGFKKVITYTTRPMRKGEKPDITYHFITEEDFKQKINKGFFAEYKTYDTEFGVWYYGTAFDDLKKADDKTVIIITPNGYKDIIGKLENKPLSIYIYANNTTIKKRMLQRGDNKNEAQRRLIHDNKYFKGIESEVDKIIYNNDGANIHNVVDKILKFWRVNE